ncbi:MAG: hypothetical protein ACKO7W_20660 [Elainella sp.]
MSNIQAMPKQDAQGRCLEHPTEVAKFFREILKKPLHLYHERLPSTHASQQFSKNSPADLPAISSHAIILPAVAGMSKGGTGPDSPMPHSISSLLELDKTVEEGIGEQLGKS